MKIRLKSMCVEGAGLITAYCDILRDDGTQVRQIAVQGKDEDEVAARARNRFAAIEAAATEGETLREKVAAAIEAINASPRGNPR